MLIPALILLIGSYRGVHLPSVKMKILLGELYRNPLLVSLMCCNFFNRTANAAACRPQTQSSLTVGSSRTSFLLNLIFSLSDLELLRNFFTASMMDLCIPRISRFQGELVMLP